MLMGDFIIVPPTDFEWMLDQPDESLDINAQLIETIQANHTVMSEYALNHPTHLKTITRDLTRRLGDLTEDIIDELSLAIDDEWGQDTVDWKEVNPFTSLMKVIARTSNRVFLGAPLCRNPDFIQNTISFANSVVPLSWLLRLVPETIKPLAAPLLTYNNKLYRRRLKKHLKTEIEKRFKELSIDSEKQPQATHNDFLQWTITAALKSDLPRETDVEILVDRVLLANFAAIHTSTISVTNAIYDLISHPSTQQTITTLREEANAILLANNGIWTKPGISQMTKIDSALKESARVGQLSAWGFVRKVTDPNGITAPASDTFLPPGASVGVPIHMIHRNPTTYPDPNTYQPLRFAELRSQTTITATNTDSNQLKPSSLTYATTSPFFQTFSHGRHACPGRFFAANELKLLTAYIVQHYDFEILEERPERPWIGQAIVCPLGNTIRVMRREKV
ncbi:hypothetical protein ES702_00134 [subsurface metagenome]